MLCFQSARRYLRSKVSQIQNSINLLEHVDLGKLDIHVVQSCTNGRDMSEELLGIISALTEYTLSTCTVCWGWHTSDGRCGELHLGMDSCQGSSPSLFHLKKTIWLKALRNLRNKITVCSTLIGINMTEIEDITDTEFDELLEHVDLGELDIAESHTV